MRRGVFCAFCCFAIGGGCGPTPHLEFQQGTNSDAEYVARIFSAPIVVVGVIESDSFVRRTHQENLDVQLRRLKVRVENVLRGDLATENALVYYYTWAGGFNGPRPLGLWDRVYRRILWLRRDSGVLRTACDGWDQCTLPADSGAHLDYKSDPQKPLGYAVADVLFTRGVGVADADFAKQVERGAPSTVPTAYLFEKLQHLAATEVPVVREAACNQLSYYHQICVDPGGKPKLP